MRIAQIAPLFEAVPPKLYGGTERIISWLTEELVAMGHDVTLFASGDSVTSAKLDAPRPRALRLDPEIKDWVENYIPATHLLLEHIYRRAHLFDVLHFHIDYFPNSLFSRQPTPFLATLHGRLDLPAFGALYRMFPDLPLVSVSNSQREPVPDLGWLGTVLHGAPRNLLTPVSAEQSYLAFLGRLSPDKGIERAIRIAGAAGIELKVAAKLHGADAEYFRTSVEPLLANGKIEFIGEIGDAEKPEFLSRARALLLPIEWPEPFGLVMIESMACGTPVIGFRRGSVPEVIEDGLTGFIVDGVDEAIAACAKLETLDRARIRARFEDRWTSRRMAEDYISLYERLVHVRRPQLRATGI